jgi:hypothetical protein
MTVSRPARRLIAAVITLAILDPFVPVIRDRLEAARYEQTGAPTRFENSDFFALGPMVEYLREHPSGSRPRTVFIGNSVLFGYGLDVRDSIPAVYERLSPSEKVFNISINGLDLSSGYLIAKSIVDSVDTVFLLCRPDPAKPILSRLMPIDERDLRRFKLTPAPAAPLSALASRWRLYRDSYRIQAALFGTSTRQYLYVHKGELARRALASIAGRTRDDYAPAEGSSNLPTVTASINASMPAADLRAAMDPDYVVVADLAQLFRERGKHLVLLQVADYVQFLSEPLAAAFNAEFMPNAAVAIIDRPAAAKLDSIHFNREGAAAMAQTLRRLADDRR